MREYPVGFMKDTASEMLTSAEKVIGQAIAIHEWEFEDGTRGGPIAEANAVDSRKKSTSQEAEPADLEAAGRQSY